MSKPETTAEIRDTKRQLRARIAELEKEVAALKANKKAAKESGDK